MSDKTEENTQEEEEQETTSQTPQGEETPTTNTEEQTSDAQKSKEGPDVKTALYQKEHFRNKFQKEKERREELEKQLQQQKPQEEEPAKDTSNKASEQIDDTWREEIEFKVNHGNLDPNFVEELKRYARGAGQTLEDAFNSDAMKAVYNEYQRKGRQEEATPTPTSRSVPSGEKKPEEMDKQELAKNYPQIVDQVLKKRKSSE